MNNLSPLPAVSEFDKLCDGSQIKDAKTIQRKVCIVSAVVLVITLLVGGFLKNPEAESASVANQETAVVETVNVE